MIKVPISKKDMALHDKDLNQQVEVHIIKQGEAFGELSLISDKPRAATIVCLENCYLATMNKKDYLKMLARIEDKQKEFVIQFF